MKRVYTIVITKEPGAPPLYRAIVPEIPLCECDGDSIEQVADTMKAEIGRSIKHGEMGSHSEPALIMRVEEPIP